MRAIVQHEYGASQDVLHLADVEMPVADAEDCLCPCVLVRPTRGTDTSSAGEPVLLRPAGLGGVRKPKFLVPGGDLAGTVEQSDSGVTAFKPGDATVRAGDLLHRLTPLSGHTADRRFGYVKHARRL